MWKNKKAENAATDQQKKPIRQKKSLKQLRNVNVNAGRSHEKKVRWGISTCWKQYIKKIQAENADTDKKKGKPSSISIVAMFFLSLRRL